MLQQHMAALQTMRRGLELSVTYESVQLLV